MAATSLQITFLGTGTSSGVPMIGCSCKVCMSQNEKDKRLRSSILVQWNNKNIVVDAGPDFRQQMLRYQVHRLDAVLLTHAHKDHIAGLDDVRAYNFFQQEPMEVYGTAATLQRVRQEFDYAFAAEKYPGIPAIHLHEIHEAAFTVAGISVLPIPVWHLRMPVVGFRFGNFTYITDANRIEEVSKTKIKGSEVLVLNALRIAPHVSHFTLQQALDLAAELKIPQVYFTHLSHQIGLHQLVNNALPPGRHIAYDGLSITI